MVLGSLATVVIALIQGAIDTPRPPASVSIRWQLPAYVLLTMGEVMVSITGLEFAYTPGAAPDEVDRHGAVAAGGDARQRASCR